MTTTPASIEELTTGASNPLWSSASAFIQGHPYIWFAIAVVLLVWMFVRFIAEAIPQIEILWSKMLTPLAARYQHRTLVKAATRSDIVGNVNRELSKLRAQLPSGWVPDLQIQWMTTDHKKSLLSETEPVLRIRPLENQERNFVNASYYFLRKNIFPRTKEVVPRGHRVATALFITSKIVRDRSGEAAHLFEDNILEREILNDASLPSLMEDYAFLDKKGFYTGTFLRELFEVAKEVRFTSQRRNISKETKSILDHIKAFTGSIPKVPGAMWSQIGPVSSYALLLVALPVKAEVGLPESYVSRAKDNLIRGAQRLYVFGANQQAGFVRQVISAIEREVPEYVLKETFALPHDFRGQPGGLGALFIRRQSIEF